MGLSTIILLLTSISVSVSSISLQKKIDKLKFDLQIQEHGAFKAEGLDKIKPNMIKVCKNIRELDEDRLYHFLEVLSQRHGDYDFRNLYKNLMSLRIDRIKNNKKENALGDYDTGKNKVRIFNDNPKRLVLEHELLHASSKYEYKDIIYSGFLQIYKNKKSIGRGLNEGYTELLSQRYFGDENFMNREYSYSELVAIVYDIEELIGQEKMESLYFRADLKGLVEELEKYFPDDRISELLYLIDFEFYYYYKKNTLSKEHKKIVDEELFKWIDKIESEIDKKEKNKFVK